MENLPLPREKTVFVDCECGFVLAIMKDDLVEDLVPRMLVHELIHRQRLGATAEGGR